MTTLTSELRLGPPLASASLPDRTPAFIADITAFTLTTTDRWLAVTADRYHRDQAESTTGTPTAEVNGEEVSA